MQFCVEEALVLAHDLAEVEQQAERHNRDAVAAAQARALQTLEQLQGRGPGGAR